LAGEGNFPYFYDQPRELHFYSYVVNAAVKGIIKMQLRGMDPFFGCEPEDVFNRLWMYKVVGLGDLMSEKTQQEFEKVLALTHKFEGNWNVTMFYANYIDDVDPYLYHGFKMVHPIQQEDTRCKKITVPVFNVMMVCGNLTMTLRIINGGELVDVSIPFEYQNDPFMRLSYFEVAVKKLMAKKVLPANAWLRFV
jgi:hypothetical protein